MPNKFDNNNNNRSRNGNSSNRAPKDKPYLRFVLYKENMDTGAAMAELSKRALFGGGKNRGGGGRFNNGRQKRLRLGYAGNKDKRGITSQFVTVPARDVSVTHLCNVFNGRRVAGSTTNQCNNTTGPDRGGSGHTRLGGAAIMHVGNFCYVRDELRLGRLQGNRFNVALRNVQLSSSGKSETTVEGSLERVAASVREKGFINYFGMQRFGKFYDTHLTGMAVLRGDFEGAVDIIMRPKDDERETITEARIRWQNRFNGDHTDRVAVEKECAKQVLGSMNRFMQNETAVLNSLARDPLNYQKAFSCIPKTMKMMFVHALQSFLWNKVASYRIEMLGAEVVEGDLVFSESDSDPRVRDGVPAVKVLTLKEVESNQYSLEDVVLPLIGAKTRNPENKSGQMFDKILSQHNLTHDMLSKLQDRDFNCAGDYRKLICRPKDVELEVIRYRDELQPLLETDFMKLNGIKVEKANDGDTEALVSAIIGFSLPSSSYATIFLRELMKHPTSSVYQKDLKLGQGGLKEETEK